jgi:hypothetical protein
MKQKKKMKEKTKSKVRRKRDPARRVIDIRTPENFNFVSEGLTQSMLAKSLCPRAFVLMLNGWTVDKPQTFFGNIIHGALAILYSRRKIPCQASARRALDTFLDSECIDIMVTDEGAITYHKARAILSAYVRVYCDDWKEQQTTAIEEEFDLPVSPTVLCRRRGKIDRRYTITNNRTGEKEVWLQEHKTHGRIQDKKLDNLLSIKFQNIWYVLTDPKIKGICHNVIRNTNSSPSVTKGETLEEYEDRIEEDALKRPAHYFMRWEINCSSTTERKLFTEDLDFLVSKCQEIQEYARHHHPPANPLVCENQEWTCDYLRACASGNLLGYIQKPLYEELSK